MYRADIMSQHWRRIVESIRLHESRSYVESLTGLPKMFEKRKTGEVGAREKHVLAYEKGV